MRRDHERGRLLCDQGAVKTLKLLRSPEQDLEHIQPRFPHREGGVGTGVTDTANQYVSVLYPEPQTHGGTGPSTKRALRTDDQGVCQHRIHR